MKRLIKWIAAVFAMAQYTADNMPDYIKILQSIANDSKL